MLALHGVSGKKEGISFFFVICRVELGLIRAPLLKSNPKKSFAEAEE